MSPPAPYINLNNFFGEPKINTATHICYWTSLFLFFATSAFFHSSSDIFFHAGRSFKLLWWMLVFHGWYIYVESVFVQFILRFTRDACFRVNQFLFVYWTILLIHADFVARILWRKYNPYSGVFMLLRIFLRKKKFPPRIE